MKKLNIKMKAVVKQKKGMDNIVRIPAYPDTGSGIMRTVIPATSGHLVRC